MAYRDQFLIMSNFVTSNSLKPTGAERAFVYQQAMELSPLLLKRGTIGVILKKNINKKKSKYAVTFILAPNVLNVKVHCEGNNLFDVCIQAKNQARKAIKDLINCYEFPGRKRQVEYLRKFPWLH